MPAEHRHALAHPDQAARRDVLPVAARPIRAVGRLAPVRPVGDFEQQRRRREPDVHVGASIGRVLRDVRERLLNDAVRRAVDELRQWTGGTVHLVVDLHAGAGEAPDQLVEVGEPLEGRHVGGAVGEPERDVEVAEGPAANVLDGAQQLLGLRDVVVDDLPGRRARQDHHVQRVAEDVVRLACDASALGCGRFHRADLGLDPPRFRVHQPALDADPLHDLDGERERGEDRHRDEQLRPYHRRIPAARGVQHC